jgi:two-component system response regulator FixJ
MVPQPRPPLIAIAESDFAVRKALRFFLESEGFEVRTFDRASTLLADPHLAQARCLIIDQGLTGGSGLDLLALLKGRGAMPPAILMTNGLLGLASARAAGLGVPVVEKPFLDDQLVTTLRSLLAR